MQDKRFNYQGNITTTETDILTTPVARRTIVTGIRFINQGSADIYAEARINSNPVLVGVIASKDGIYDKDTRLELLPGQSLSLIGEGSGLKYCITVVEVDN